MEFVDFQIGGIGDLQTSDQFGWVEVRMKFRHPHFEAYPTLIMNVPVHYERDWSISQIRTVAFETAHAMIEDAKAQFDERGHSLRPEGLPKEPHSLAD
tara:strand:+ start:1598 stop:1891 length:294 start_codon:yes stop_codon:yes gene_type:complete